MRSVIDVYSESKPERWSLALLVAEVHPLASQLFAHRAAFLSRMLTRAHPGLAPVSIVVRFWYTLKLEERNSYKVDYMRLSATHKSSGNSLMLNMLA